MNVTAIGRPPAAASRDEQDTSSTNPSADGSRLKRGGAGAVRSTPDSTPRTTIGMSACMQSAGLSPGTPFATSEVVSCQPSAKRTCVSGAVCDEDSGAATEIGDSVQSSPAPGQPPLDTWSTAHVASWLTDAMDMPNLAESAAASLVDGGMAGHGWQCRSAESLTISYCQRVLATVSNCQCVSFSGI